MKIRNSIFYLLVIIFLSGCVSRKKVQYYQGIESLQNSKIYSEDKVNIKPDDRLIINVFSSNQNAAQPFNPNTSSSSSSGGNGGGNGGNRNIEYMVSREGTIFFPVLGEIKAEGYSVIEFAKKLEEEISPYLSDPLVMVRIQNFQISFVGAVTGALEVDDDQINLSQALSLIGGVDDRGKIDNVLVIREKNGVRTHSRLDLTKAEVINSPYYYLEQNDIVYIEPTAPARQGRGYLGTISNYIGLVSSVLSLIVIFTR